MYKTEKEKEKEKEKNSDSDSDSNSDSNSEEEQYNNTIKKFDIAWSIREKLFQYVDEFYLPLIELLEVDDIIELSNSYQV